MSNLASFLAPFSAATAAAVTTAAADAPVVGADAVTRQFRLDPGAALDAVEAQMRALTRERVPERIAWCYTGDLVNGLEPFELSAVLGRHLDIESIAQAEAGDERRVVAIGRPRVHHPVIAVNAAGAADDELKAILTESTSGDWPGTLVWLSAARMREVMSGPCRADLSAFMERGGEVGLFVPSAETNDALADPVGYIRESGVPVRFVRFERGTELEMPALTAFMRGSGLRCDVSLSIDSGAAGRGDTSRHAAFAGPSPYFPQPFDLRVPSYSPQRPPFIELPAIPLSGDDPIGAWWALVTWPDDETLASRLDAQRIAGFFRASRNVPELEREFPSFRIYNWPRPSPRRRVSLLDAGRSVAHLTQLKRGLLAIREHVGAAVEMPRAAELIGLAEQEAASRYSLSTTGAIDVQHAAHSYLTDVPREGPLRVDYAEFARFMPASLGSTLEIGSGYGVLAWALSPRASRYVCLDLDRTMFRALRADLGQAGIVGDAHQLPFADASFDSLVANNVIEHFYDPLRGLGEIRRVLRPGGSLFALVPFDALNSRHELPAHLWKLDLDGLTRALTAADLSIGRVDVLDLHEMGVPGAFPSCLGRAAMVEALRPAAQALTAEPQISIRDAPAGRQQGGGRLWPSIREMARFESYDGRRVLAVGAPSDDVVEFRHFGANVTAVPASLPWPVADGVFDFVYVFLPDVASDLALLAAEIGRAMAPGGRAVAVFRNRRSLRVLSRLRSYFGEACDLLELAGPGRLIASVEPDAASGRQYVEAGDVERSFARFPDRRLRVSNLLPEDLRAGQLPSYPPGFWTWMSETFGRFIVVAVAQ